ncbi:MAG: Rne/Rng family ribonuclease [Rhodobacteraceae bacterium]|nr:Rne/Rng family ribonuclease [Paracoccaceae bacterium]
MAKKMLIDATHAEETRVVVVDGNKVDEFDFESVNKRQLAGNIYLAKVTRVEPSLQAAFVDYGGNRHGFLAFSEIHPDYYQIPVADREALLAEERAYAASLDEDDTAEKEKPKRRTRSRRKPKADSRPETGAETSEAGADEAPVQDVDATAEPVAQAAATAVSAPEAEQSPDAGDDTPPTTMAASARNDDPVETRDIPGMDVVDLDDEAEAETRDEPDEPVKFSRRSRRSAPRPDPEAEEGTDEAVSDPAARDDQIESIADEDVSEEIRPRKPRARRYKIQEVVKVRQIMLVQVVKEERGNKGAALTTYLSLAGRYCVLMPNTARGGGISRKITVAADRKKLKEIASEFDVPEGAGLIIRTAGANRTKSEIKRDYEYLQRLWEQIRELTLKSIAPAPIYEEGNLIKRSIRDLYNREIDEVLVEGDEGYRVAKDFMKMIMPSHAKNVKHYHDPMPLFARFQVESYLSSMFNPTVQLRSGGYIVIGVTEALVAIDVNSGRATKEGSIEETATKTNLEAAEEVARQLRLRDLAGLIVIDFIDMEERKNNAAVEKRLKDKLKTDRARIQIGRISGFGLLEMSRQRLRPGMIEATTQPCPHCHGTGLIRSDDSLALSILRQIEEEGVRGRSREVLVKAPVGIVNYLMNHKREHVAQIEARYGISVRIEADPFLISPDFSMERFKTAIRTVPEVNAPVIKLDMSDMPDAVEEPEEAVVIAETAPVEPVEGEDKPTKKRRRRRRSKKKPGINGENGAEGTEAEGSEDEAAPAEAAQTPEPVAEDGEEKPAKSRSRSGRSRSNRSRSRKSDRPEEGTEAEVAQPVETAPVEAPAAPAQATPEPVPEPAPEPAAAISAPEPVAVVAAPEPVAPAPAAQPEPAPKAEKDTSSEPKKRGWWSLGR